MTDIVERRRVFEWDEALYEWRDISTAPKDGTEILAFSEHGIRVVHYDPYRKWEWFVPLANGGSGTFCHPTHWMPLPEPPEEKK